MNDRALNPTSDAAARPGFSPVKPHEHDRAVDVMSRAFEDDPGYRWLFPDAKTRLAHIAWIYRRILRANGAFGATYAVTSSATPPDGSADRGAAIVGVSSWWPPGKEVGPIEMLKVGVLRAPFSLGASATARMLRAASAIEKHRHRVMKGRPHWFLDQLAVDPAKQGQGLGAFALDSSYERFVDPSRLPAMLVTAKESNVAFYRGRGFVDMGCEWVAGEGSFRLWAMVREPERPGP